MVFLDDLKEMTLYKKPFVLPIDEENIRKGSAIFLVSPNAETSKAMMNYPYMINKMNTFNGYYLEKNANYYINQEGNLIPIDRDDEYLHEVSEEELEEGFFNKDKQKRQDSSSGYNDFLHKNYATESEWKAKYRSDFIATYKACIRKAESIGKLIMGGQAVKDGLFSYPDLHDDWPSSEMIKYMDKYEGGPNDRKSGICLKSLVVVETDFSGYSPKSTVDAILNKIEKDLTDCIPAKYRDESQKMFFRIKRFNGGNFMLIANSIIMHESVSYDKETTSIAESAEEPEPEPYCMKESKDNSKYSPSFKKKTGKNFKYIQFPGAEAEKYLSNDTHWNKESIDDFKKRKVGEVAIDTDANAVAGWIFVNKSGTTGPLRVYDEYKGYGISSVLVSDAVNKYKGKELGVYSDNEIAIRVYEKNGFRTQRTKTYKDGDKVYIMKLDENALRLGSALITEAHDFEKYNPNFKKKTGGNFEFLDIHSAEAQEYLASDKYYNKQIKKYISIINGEIVVDKDAGKVAGAIYVGGGNKKTNRNYGFIQTLEVYKPYRGYGLSNKLLDDAIKKYNAVDLTVYKDNDVASELYKKHGFVIIGAGNTKHSDYWMKLKSKLTEEDKKRMEAFNEAGEEGIEEEYTYYNNKKYKKVPKSAKLYHGSRTQGLKELVPKNDSISRVGNATAVYASKDKRFAACYGTAWRDDIAKQGTWDKWNTVVMGISDKVVMDQPCSLYELENDGSFIEISDKEVVSLNTIKVKKEHKYSSYAEMLKQNGVKVISYDEYIKNVKSPNPEFHYLNEGSVPMYLYHGSLGAYDELKATGIDFGNTFQGPGWSLFTWATYEPAISWSVFCILRKLAKKHPIEIKGCKNSKFANITESSYKWLSENLDKVPKNERTFYVYTIKGDTSYSYGLGHSSNTPGCITVRTNDTIKPYKVDKYVMDMSHIDNNCVVVPDDFSPKDKDLGKNYRLMSFFMKYDFMYNQGIRKILNNAVKNGELEIGDDIAQYLKDNGIDIKKVSFKERLSDMLHTEAVLSSKERNELSDSDFGIPSLRKYPLTDAQHVKSAIRFFNYVDSEYESELAKNIKRKAIEFKVPIRCGEGNRLSKYITEEYVQEFMSVASIGNDMTAVCNGTIKQHMAQGDMVYSFDHQKPYTKKTKAKKKEEPVTEAEARPLTRDDIKSEFFEKGDSDFNLDKLSPQNNILYITGLSGSGKTTLGISLRKEFDCYRVELDAVCAYYMKSFHEAGRTQKFYDYLKKECPEAVEFLDNREPGYYGYFENWGEAEKAAKDFVDWFVPKVIGNGNMYIINGAQIPELYPAEYFADKPIIIKGTSYLKTAMRRTQREMEVDGNTLAKIVSACDHLRVCLSRSYIQSKFKFDRYTKDIARLNEWDEPEDVFFDDMIKDIEKFCNEEPEPFPTDVLNEKKGSH